MSRTVVYEIIGKQVKISVGSDRMVRGIVTDVGSDRVVKLQNAEILNRRKIQSPEGTGATQDVIAWDKMPGKLYVPIESINYILKEENDSEYLDTTYNKKNEESRTNTHI